MPVTPSLLRAAHEAEVRLADAEHGVVVARAEFHRTVRHLSLAGGSLREIGTALGLSHQRVHQIVEAANHGRAWGAVRTARDDGDGDRRCRQGRAVARPLQLLRQTARPSGAMAAASDALICVECLTVVAEIVAQEL
jgi:hypothetical protein